MVATPATTVGPAVATGAARAASGPDGDDRFVVQVGAYTDPATLREARQKVERLGLKTYTQVIETDAGRRTRVRVGPFDSRADADEAARRLKAAGLPANILVL
ncbi:MAG: SPOR domain-containing protein [Rubrivivax sp.]|nr:SPOR domain-containing protein [Rubrivivax sp.]